MSSKMKLLTIGHSTHPLDRFLALLAQHNIKALVDIRHFLVGAWVSSTEAAGSVSSGPVEEGRGSNCPPARNR